jgi:hypothetical protein
MDALPLADWAHAALERHGVPPGAPARQPAYIAELVSAWRRVLETALVEHLTIPELAAVARFYATPEGASTVRKMLAFNAAVTPVLEPELVAWVRAGAARVRPQASAGEAP